MDNSDTLNQRDAGLRAFSKNDFELAIAILTPCAEAGDTKSQMLLARMYYAGNGVSANPEKHLYWLEKAAAGGNKSAKSKLKRLRSEDQ